MQFKMTSKYLLATLPLGIAMALGSCGGGDDDTTPNPTTNLNPSGGSTTGTSTQPVKYQLTRADRDYGGDGTVNAIYTYTSDTAGNLTKWESYGERGELRYVATFSYDASKKLTKQEWDSEDYVTGQSVPLDGVIDGTVEYGYDSHGNLTKEVTKNRNFSSTLTQVNVYDAKGQSIQEQVDFGGDGTIDTTTDYTYDANGNVIKTDTITDYGTTSTTFAYDANGNVTRTETVFNESRFVTTYTYDARGRATKVETTFPEGYQYTETYTYNANGKVEKYQRSGGDSDVENYSFIYAYDGNGNVVEEKNYDKSGKLLDLTRYSWQPGNGYRAFYASTDACLLVRRISSPEEELFDSVFGK